MEENIDFVKHIATVSEMKKHIRPLYIIDEYTESEEKYIEFRSSIEKLMQGCIEHKECREYPVKFKFYLNDKDTHTLQLRHFFVNVIMWFAFTELHGIHVLNKNYILDCFKDVTSKGLKNYINEVVIQTLRDYNIDNNIMNNNLSDILYNLRKISIDFSDIMGLGMYTQSFMDMYRKYPRLREIMSTKFDSKMQPNEIEDELNKLMKEEVEIFKSEPNNIVGIILRAGTGIKDKQLCEFSINGGMKPSLEGNTIPIPINSNTLTGGLNCVSSIYLDALGARKSLIMNKKVMGKAGYVGKIIVMLARTLELSKDVSDCGTRHYVNVTITDDKFLQKLNGRFYKAAGDKDFHILKSRKHKELIGQTIQLRSPATCALDDKVCQKCYGFNANINYDIANGISAFGTQEYTKEVNQRVLSAKHLLSTLSQKINFNKDFDLFFNILLGEISVKASEEALEDIEDWAIIVEPDDMAKCEELDDDSLYNNYIKNGTFYVRNLKTGEDITLKEENGKELFLTNECISLLKSGKGMIKFKDIDDSISLFVMDITNNELTKPLYEIIDLLNKVKLKGQEETIDSMCQKIIELFVISGIDASGVQGELIINRLLRADEDSYERPDFSHAAFPSYSILTVSRALEHNKSPLLGMSFQEIKRQILSDDTFYKKDATCYLDPLYQKKISTKRLKKYR